MDKLQKNITSAVYDHIYKNIINLTLVPGTVMSAADISKKINVSRTPVREAFIMLSNIGLVEVTPNKNTIVTKIDLDMMEEERFMRFCMEIGALEIFMANKKKEHILKLEQSIVLQEEAVKNNDYEAFLKYDNDFHTTFFQVANKEKCLKIIQNNSNNYMRIRLLSHRETPISKINLEQHKFLLNKIREDNFYAAKIALEEHLSKIIDEKDELIKKYSDYIKVETLKFPDDLFNTL